MGASHGAEAKPPLAKVRTLLVVRLWFTTPQELASDVHCFRPSSERRILQRIPLVILDAGMCATSHSQLEDQIAAPRVAAPLRVAPHLACRFDFDRIFVTIFFLFLQFSALG